jgi:hypothetical protein
MTATTLVEMAVANMAIQKVGSHVSLNRVVQTIVRVVQTFLAGWMRRALAVMFIAS